MASEKVLAAKTVENVEGGLDVIQGHKENPLQHIPIDEATNKRLLRKVDMRLMPVVRGINPSCDGNLGS